MVLEKTIFDKGGSATVDSDDWGVEPISDKDQQDRFAALRQGGFRLTAPRLRVAELFADGNRWISPQELYHEAEARGINVGLTTVYRLLEAMSAVGLARRFAQEGRAYRYVYCHPGHHHHWICRACGHVEEIEECLVQPPKQKGFHVEGHVLDFFGLCDDCYRQAHRSEGLRSEGRRKEEPQ